MILITDPAHIEFIRKSIRDAFDKCTTVTDDMYYIAMARDLNQFDLAEEMEKDSINHYIY